MVRITYDKDYKHIELLGHTNETLCASISSLIFFSVNLAMDFNMFFGGIRLTDDGQDKMEIFNETSDENVKKVFANLILHLEDLQRQYPESVQVILL